MSTENLLHSSVFYRSSADLSYARSCFLFTPLSLLLLLLSRWIIKKERQ